MEGNLTLLDLSDNLLSGGLTDCWKNLLKLVRSIDFSNNNLSGTIPDDLFKLSELMSLNLSYNRLEGSLPEGIGNLKKLESFDVALNQLFGEIPQSLAQLSFLALLNLSYNQFSGQISSGTQSGSFSESSFKGNLNLCGRPLIKNCTVKEPATNPAKVAKVAKVHNNFLPSFYMGLGVVLGTSYWGFYCAIFFSRRCRHCLFKIIRRIRDKIYCGERLLHRGVVAPR